MKNKLKCFLTREMLKEGDIIIRPIFSSFEKHILVRFTKQGIVVSRKAYRSINSNMCWTVSDEDIKNHNIIYYISYPSALIKIGEYKGDLTKFNKTIKQYQKQFKENTQ